MSDFKSSIFLPKSDINVPKSDFKSPNNFFISQNPMQSPEMVRMNRNKSKAVP